MELRRFAIVMVFFMVAKCSDSHLVHRRQADDMFYEDTQADAANDDDFVQDDSSSEPEETPAVIVTQPKTYEVKLGEDLILECKVEPEKGTVAQWYKDGVLYFLGNMKMKFDATRLSIINGTKYLHIKNATREDNGVYKCEIVRRSAPLIVNHTVKVLEPPKILRLLATDGGSVVEGNDVKLTCEVTGVPPPQILWSRDSQGGNERLKEKDNEFSLNSVTIKNITKEKAGKYYCYVINNIGNNQAEITISVAGKPRVHVPRSIVNSDIRVEAVLECTAHEEPNPSIRWYKDGKVIDSSSSYIITTHGIYSNLTVIPQTDADFGVFTCEAENKHGRHSKSIELTQKPIVENYDVVGPKLSWTVRSHQPLINMEVQLRRFESDTEWKIISVPLPQKMSHVYDIIFDLSDKDLEPGKYEAAVRVTNKSGSGDNNNVLNVGIEQQAQLIQTASVIGGSNYGHSTRPSIAVLASFFIYLLVRMF